MDNTAFLAFHKIYAFGSWHLNGFFVCLATTIWLSNHVTNLCVWLPCSV